MDSNSRFLVNTTRTKEGRGTESLQTPRWREKDSNLSYRGTKARNSEASRASRVEDLAFSSTARQRRIRLPVIRVTISSRCHRALGRDGRRNRRAVSDPELHHPAPKLSSPIGRGAQRNPNRVLNLGWVGFGTVITCFAPHYKPEASRCGTTDAQYLRQRQPYYHLAIRRPSRVARR